MKNKINKPRKYLLFVLLSSISLLIIYHYQFNKILTTSTEEKTSSLGKKKLKTLEITWQDLAQYDPKNGTLPAAIED